MLDRSEIAHARPAPLTHPPDQLSLGFGAAIEQLLELGIDAVGDRSSCFGEAAPETHRPSSSDE